MRLTMDPELIIREEEWVIHKMGEGNFDPKKGAAGVAKVREAGFHEIAKEEEFKRDRQDWNQVDDQSQLGGKRSHQ